MAVHTWFQCAVSTLVHTEAKCAHAKPADVACCYMLIFYWSESKNSTSDHFVCCSLVGHFSAFVWYMPLQYNACFFMLQTTLSISEFSGHQWGQSVRCTKHPVHTMLGSLSKLHEKKKVIDAHNVCKMWSLDVCKELAWMQAAPKLWLKATWLVQRNDENQQLISHSILVYIPDIKMDEIW